MTVRASVLFPVVFGALVATSGCSGTAQNSSEQLLVLTGNGSTSVNDNFEETLSNSGESDVSTVASSTDMSAAGATSAIHDMKIDEAISGTTNSGMTDVDARMGLSDNLTVESRMQAADAEMQDAQRRIDAATNASRRAAAEAQ
jgi:hypothetical protein